MSVQPKSNFLRLKMCYKQQEWFWLKIWINMCFSRCKSKVLSRVKRRQCWAAVTIDSKIAAGEEIKGDSIKGSDAVRL